MNKALQQKTERWMALERKTLEQRRKADEFYEHEMMGNIVSEYIDNNKAKVNEPVKYLILSVGTSYEPLVLNISLLQPEKILFLYTDTSEKILDKIMDFCSLKMSQVQKRKVTEIEPTDIYREIKKCYLEWDRPDKIYIDFTGGTKAMATAAAMAGAMINVQMIYVGTTQYMAHFRKPFPGSETLYYISDPMSIFGDLEIEKAYTLFGQFNYAGVRERLYELKEEVPDPVIRQELNLVYLLAKAYGNWDALDFARAYESISRLGKEIRRDKKSNYNFILSDFENHFSVQESFLKHLSTIPELVKEKQNIEILQKEDTIVPLMFTMYQNAMTREAQEKYDMATLLLYRLLEMVEQKRLSAYHLFVSRMEYDKMLINGRPVSADDLKKLKDTVNSLKGKLFGRCRSSNLPDPVSLLEGFILLAALEDPIVYRNQDAIPQLRRIRAMVALRNNSIFAHGLAPVPYTDYIKFKRFVKELFEEHCRLENLDFQKILIQIKWVSPLESQYYQKR